LVALNLQDVITQVGEIVTDMCHVGVRFIYVGLFGETFPYFSVKKLHICTYYDNFSGDQPPLETPDAPIHTQKSGGARTALA